MSNKRRRHQRPLSSPVLAAPPKLISRRRWLKWALLGGAAAAIAAGGISFPSVRDYFRRRRTVSYKIEQHPDSSKREVFWYKPNKGEIREAGGQGKEKEIYSEPPRKGDRSSLHTHPAQVGSNMGINYVNRFFGSNPSPQDIFSAVQQAKEGQVRTAHVAVMNAENKVMGYFSYRFGKKLLENKKKLDEIEKKMTGFNSKVNTLSTNPAIVSNPELVKRMIIVFADYLDYLDSCKKDGLLIHKTPMPGMQYKDGMFQSK